MPVQFNPVSRIPADIIGGRHHSRLQHEGFHRR